MVGNLFLGKKSLIFDLYFLPKHEHLFGQTPFVIQLRFETCLFDQTRFWSIDQWGAGKQSDLQQWAVILWMFHKQHLMNSRFFLYYQTFQSPSPPVPMLLVSLWGLVLLLFISLLFKKILKHDTWGSSERSRSCNSHFFFDSFGRFFSFCAVCSKNSKKFLIIIERGEGGISKLGKRPPPVSDPEPVFSKGPLLF